MAQRILAFIQNTHDLNPVLPDTVVNGMMVVNMAPITRLDVTMIPPH